MADPIRTVLVEQKLIYEERIAELTKERDEARRDICCMMHMTGFLAGDYAHSKGWDCFKDGYNGFSPEIQNFRDIFYRYKDELRAERDEARREVCMNEANHLPTMADPHREAKRRGWDCFKETHNDI